MPERSHLIEPIPIEARAFAKIRRFVDVLEYRLDNFQTEMLNAHGDLSDEYDEAKQLYRLAAALHIEFDKLGR